jgi:glycosyltransferase involved in cell wall biosynthesis
MRILQVHTHYRQAGGEDAVVAAESALLRDSGHEVVEWRNANPTDPVASIKALAVGAWNRGAARRFQTETDGSFDVAHIHNTWYATTASILPGLVERGIPIVMTLHNYRLTCANALLLRDGAPCELCVGSSPWSAVRYSCYRDSRPASLFAAAAIALNRKQDAWAGTVDRFLVLTEFARRTWVRAGLPADKIMVKSNFVADPGERPAAPSESTRILSVGRLSEEKGMRTLVEAWRQSNPAGFTLSIAGDGPLLDELTATAPEGVEFLGRVDSDEVRRLMLTSRSLVFPSEVYEGMPITLLEAMAAGLPVVASNHGSMVEMIEPLGSDWLTPPGDVAEWAARLDALGTADVNGAGAMAREQWERHYAPAVALPALEAAYRL